MSTPWQRLAEFSGQNPGRIDLALSQRQWLFDCLERNQSSLYGREHHFARLDSISDYQKEVPIISYPDIQPYIDDMESGKQDCLFSGSVIAFESTSGTRGGQKLIPYSEHSLQDFRRAILPWLTGLASRHQIESGFAYWAISPATRASQKTSAGVPVGLPDAAYLGDELLPFFQDVSAVPAWVGSLEDINDWQLATLYHLVCCKTLTLVSVWSPTFWISLANALISRNQEIKAILSDGFDLHGYELSANHEALDRFQDFIEHDSYNRLWPDLKVISCWADGSSKSFADQIRQRFPGVQLQPKGLLMTEGVVTTPDNKGNRLLAASSGFYEFIDPDKNLKLAHELEAGKIYELIMTTAGGLYRYRTEDLVCCDGRASRIPNLRFIGRKSSTDLVGEKITEAFANACLEDISGFRMLLPRKAKEAGYVLILEDQPQTETLVHRVEARLCKNPQYAYARKMGQLKPLAVSPLHNPLQVYLNSPVHGNARLGDIKLPALCLKPSIFDGHIETLD